VVKLGQVIFKVFKLTDYPFATHRVTVPLSLRSPAPMTQSPNAASAMRPRTLFAIVLVVAIAAATTLHRLDAADVCGSNEAVEAVFLQQMVEHDALLFPLENGRSPMYKPPLFHWTAVAIDRLAGIRKVTAFNLRLPAALYAIAGVILTIAFACTILGPSGGVVAGLILTASYQYLENARIGRVDMTLCFFETLSLFAFARWFTASSASSGDSQDSGEPESTFDRHLSSSKEPGELENSLGSRARESCGTGEIGNNPLSLSKERGRERSLPQPPTDSLSSTHVADAAARSAFGANYLRYILAAALGLAVLAKGPVGALLPGVAIAIFLVTERRLNDLWKLVTLGPVVVTLALGSSWYLACLFGQRYGFLDRQIGSENFGRFFGALGAMTPWYYLKPILLNSVPLSLLVPFAVFSALRTYWRSGLAQASDSDRSGTVRAGEKRPSQNPISLWMSLRMMFLPAVDASTPPRSQSSRSSIEDPGAQSPRALVAVRLFAIFWVVTVLFFTVAAYKRRAYLLPLWPASAVTLSWWLTSFARSRRGKFLRPTVIAICGVLVAINFFYFPRKEIRECAGDSMRTAAAQINRIVGSNEPLYLFDFEDEPAPLLFYLDRLAPRIEGRLGDAPPGYVITTAEAWRRLQPQALDLQPVFESSSGRPRLVLLRHGKALAFLDD
jgi:4-amino-4-deoxy-L-arabinose transferase-like glycosyltransferase